MSRCSVFFKYLKLVDYDELSLQKVVIPLLDYNEVCIRVRHKRKAKIPQISEHLGCTTTFSHLNLSNNLNSYLDHSEKK